MPWRQQCRADARPRFCVRGALDHRSGATFGLPAAQCAGANERDAAQRQADPFAERRDRGACRRLQTAFAGDLARLAILGDARRLRRHDRRAAPSRQSEMSETLWLFVLRMIVSENRWPLFKIIL